VPSLVAGWDFTRRHGGSAKNVEFFVCLSVTLLNAQFRHEGVGEQKRF